MKILLDYFMPVTAIEPTPQANTGFLRQVLAIVKPKGGVTPGTITATTSTSQVAALTDNLDVAQLFAGGMSRVFVLPVAALTDVDEALVQKQGEFFTVLISSDFTDANVGTLDIGALFSGVIGVSSSDDAFLAAQAAISNRVAFHTTVTNKAKNMFFAFGKLLSNARSWKNQQYITMPFADDVDTLGEANNLFDDKISFVLSDDEFGNRLGLFAVGGKAIIAPYVIKNLQIDLQSAALTYVSGNQPAYTLKEAALLENVMNKVITRYIEDEAIEAGTASVKLIQDNFVAGADLDVAEPNALWRIFAEMKQTL